MSDDTRSAATGPTWADVEALAARCRAADELERTHPLENVYPDTCMDCGQRTVTKQGADSCDACLTNPGITRQPEYFTPGKDIDVIHELRARDLDDADAGSHDAQLRMLQRRRAEKGAPPAKGRNR